MMFTIPNVGVNQQSSLKGMASQKSGIIPEMISLPKLKKSP